MSYVCRYWYHSVMRVCLGIPRNIHSTIDTCAHCYAYQYPSLLPVLFYNPSLSLFKSSFSCLCSFFDKNIALPAIYNRIFSLLNIFVVAQGYEMYYLLLWIITQMQYKILSYGALYVSPLVSAMLKSISTLRMVFSILVDLWAPSFHCKEVRKVLGSSSQQHMVPSNSTVHFE